MIPPPNMFCGECLFRRLETHRLNPDGSCPVCGAYSDAPTVTAYKARHGEPVGVASTPLDREPGTCYPVDPGLDGGARRQRRLANETDPQAMLPCRCGRVHAPGYFPTVDLRAGLPGAVELAWLDRGEGACFPLRLPSCGPYVVVTHLPDRGGLAMVAVDIRSMGDGQYLDPGLVAEVVTNLRGAVRKPGVCPPP